MTFFRSVRGPLEESMVDAIAENHPPADATSVLSTRTSPTYSQTLDSAPSQVVSTITRLRFLFDSRLTFLNHFKSVLSKFRQRVNLLCYNVKSSNNKSTHDLIQRVRETDGGICSSVWSFRLTAKHTEMYCKGPDQLF
eukprot:scpid74249/ scgid9034/ 